MLKLVATFLIGIPMVLAPLAGAQPLEDEPGWDCTTMGNRVCGTRVLVCQPTERDGQLYLDQCDWYDTEEARN